MPFIVSFYTNQTKKMEHTLATPLIDDFNLEEKLKEKNELETIRKEVSMSIKLISGHVKELRDEQQALMQKFQNYENKKTTIDSNVAVLVAKVMGIDSKIVSINKEIKSHDIDNMNKLRDSCLYVQQKMCSTGNELSEDFKEFEKCFCEGVELDDAFIKNALKLKHKIATVKAQLNNYLDAFDTLVDV